MRTTTGHRAARRHGQAGTHRMPSPSLTYEGDSTGDIDMLEERMHTDSHGTKADGRRFRKVSAMRRRGLHSSIMTLVFSVMMVVAENPSVAMSVEQLQEEYQTNMENERREEEERRKEQEKADAEAQGQTAIEQTAVTAEQSVSVTDEGNPDAPTVDATNPEPERIIVRFDANAETVRKANPDTPMEPDGAMDDMEVILDGSEWVLPQNAYTLGEAYEFKNWSTTKDGKSIKDDKDTPDIDESLKARSLDDQERMQDLEFWWEHEGTDEEGNKITKSDRESLAYAKRDGTVTLYAQWKKTEAPSDKQDEQSTAPVQDDNPQQQDDTQQHDGHAPPADTTDTTNATDQQDDTPATNESENPENAGDGQEGTTNGDGGNGEDTSTEDADKTPGSSEATDPESEATKDADESDEGDTSDGADASTAEGSEPSQEIDEKKDDGADADKKDITTALPSDVIGTGKAYLLRLIVKLDDPRLIREEDAVLGRVDDTYLLGYDTITQLMEAKAFYNKVASFAEIDLGLDIAGGDTEPTPNNKPVPMTATDNPLEALNESKEDDKQSQPQAQEQPKTNSSSDSPLVALLDTGAPVGESLAGSTSMLGDDGVDRNGHARLMLETMRNQNPDVRVLSVKVLDDTGHGTASSVYAGIIYAVDNGAEILNLSFAGADTTGSQAIREAVQYALDKGAVVIAAAGNGGYDASLVTPANVEGVFTVGAAENGQVRADSNRSECVDVYVEALSTSVATAKVSGQVSLGLYGWRERVSKMGVNAGTPVAGSVVMPDDEGVGAAATGSRAGTAYAVLDSAGTLTLFRSTNSYTAGTGKTVTDVMGRTYTGQVWTGIETNTGTGNYSAPWSTKRSSIKLERIATGQVIAPKSCAGWFYSCSQMTAFEGAERLDTSALTSMASMFYGCSAMTEPPAVGSWDTSAVTNMSSMFYGCSAMTAPPAVGSWNTSVVTDMNSMFYGCSAMTAPPAVGSWNTSKVTNISNMFYNCSSMTKPPAVGSWNTSAVTTMVRMFYGCSAMTKPPAVGSWNTSKVTNISNMFYNCSSMTKPPAVGSWNTGKVTSMIGIFNNCNAMTESPEVSGWNTSAVTYMESMFNNCSAMTETPAVGSWNTSTVTNMSSMFNNCSKLTSLDVSGWDFNLPSSVYRLGLGGCSSLMELKVPAGAKITGLPEHSAQGLYLSTWGNTERGITGSTAADMVTTINEGNGAGTWEWETNVPVARFERNFSKVSGWMEPIALGSGVTTPACTFTVPSTMQFTNWNTSPDGLGTTYAVGDALPTGSDIRLYAQWYDMLAGTAYAIYNETSKTLTFFRSTNTYANNTSVTDATDIMGNTYSGKVYTGFEESTSGNPPWYYKINLASTVIFADNQIIRPRSTALWFADMGIQAFDNIENLDTSNVTNMLQMFNMSRIYSNYLDLSSFDTSNVTNMYGMFYYCTTLTSVDVSTWDTSSVTDMSEMFFFCYNLASVDVSTWDTSNVTNMSDMFDTCPSLTSLDVSNWDFSKITSSSNYLGLESCDHLVRLSVSSDSKVTVTNYPAYGSYTDTWGNASQSVTGFTATQMKDRINAGNGAGTWLRELKGTAYAVLATNGTLTLFRSTNTYSGGSATQTVTDVDGNTYTGQVYTNIENQTGTNYNSALWYDQHSSIKSVTIPSGQVIRPKNCAAWFNKCKNLTSTNLGSLDTSQCTNMYAMFSECSQMTTPPDVSHWNTGNVTNMRAMFSDCPKMTTTPNVSQWNTGNVTNMKSMFSGCSAMTTTPNVSQWNTGNVTNMESMFSSCSAMTTTPNVSQWNTGKVTNMKSIFSSCSAMTTTPNVSQWNTGNVTNMESMFGSCSAMTTPPDVSHWNTGKVTDMDAMFHRCSAMTTPPNVSEWNTGKVTSMTSMFYGCSAMTTPPNVSEWDTGNVTSMYSTFSECSRMTTPPDVSEWDTGNVTSMMGMFSGCSAMTTPPDVSEWDTGNVTSMKCMFYGCSKMTTPPNVSEWNTSNVTDMVQMFYGCSAMTTLDLSSFDTSKVTTMEQMFSYCNALNSVTLGENFSFKGNNITYYTYQAILPKTITSPYTGKWVNTSVTGANAVTPEALRDNYDGSATTGDYARGTYVRETVCTVTFKTGNTTMGTQTVTPGTATALTPVASLSDEPVSGTYDWSFVGWATSVNTFAYAYADGANITVTSDVTLYAVYSRSIHFSYYGSASATSSEGMLKSQWYYNTSATAAATTDVSTVSLYTQSTYGWTPLGWSTSSTSSTVSVSQTGSTATTVNPSATSDACHYYAVYNRLVRFTYNPNGGTSTPGDTPASSVSPNQTYNAGADQGSAVSITTAAAITKTNYKFNGWALDSATGSTTYSASTSVTHPSRAWDSNQVRTLYATWWQPTVTFKTGNTTMGTQVVNYDVNTALTAVANLSNAPVSGHGWSFEGWAQSTGTTITNYSDSGNITTTANVTLYAVYSRTVQFWYYPTDSSKSVYKVSTKQHYYNTSTNAAGTEALQTYSLHAQSTYGWAPLGWTTDSTATTASVSQTGSTTTTVNPSATSDSLTYYAVYNRLVRFTYNPNGGTSTPGNTPASSVSPNQTYNAGADQGSAVSITTAAAITKTNYKFNGWALDSATGSTTYSASTSVTHPSRAWDSNQVRTLYATWWQPTVTFKTGNTTMGTQVVNYDVNTALTTVANLSNAPVSGHGWSFVGWTTNASSATTASYTNSANIKITADTTLYAIYKRSISFKYYASATAASITTSTRDQFYRNTSTTAASVSGVSSYALYTMTTSGATINGFAPLGWRTDGTASTASNAQTNATTITLTPAANTQPTYRAVYSRIVPFYSGQSKATTTNITQYYNSDGAWALTTATAAQCADISNWTELGWRADTTAGAATKGFNTSWDSSANAFYAVYSRNRAITYANGGGTGTAPSNTSATQYYNTNPTTSTPSFTLANNTFTRTGYTFSKWDLGNAGATYTGWTPEVTNNTATKTATAQWTAHQYTVVYNKNGGSGTMSNSTFTYDGSGNLTANAFTAPSNLGGANWTFGGWADSVANATAGRVYRANQAAHENMTGTNGGTVNLYAIWKRDVSFISGVNGSTTTKVTQYWDGANGTAGKVTVPTAAQCTDVTGWAELGWIRASEAGSATSIYYTFGTTPNDQPTRTTTWYALYSTAITFYSGYNKGTTGTATGYYDSSDTSRVLAPAPATLSYWTANGWRADTNATSSSYAVTTATTITGFGTNKTFYHVYSQVPVMSYAGNSNTGGSTLSTNGTTRYLNSGNTTLSSGDATWTLASNGFTRTGYTFNGWNLGAAGTSYSVAVAYNASPDKTATAQWTANTYTITYGGMTNATHGTNHPTSATYDTQFTVDNPTRIGYTFTGWNITGMDSVTHTYGGTSTTTATSISSTTATTFKNLRSTSGTVTFTAQWSKNNYTITFDANGGSVSPASKSYAYASTATDLPTPTRTGYTFNGWYYDLDGTASINYGRDLMFTNATSVSFRAYAADWSVAANQRIISCTENGGWNIENNGGYIQFAIYQSESGYKHAKSSVTWASLAAGWHEFELIHTGSAGTVYLDGTQIATVAVGTLGFNATNSLFVGAEAVGTQTGNNTLFNGRIENIVIKNDSTRRSHSSLKNSLTVPAQNATVKAEWINNSYTVVYNANGGSGTMSNSTFTYDVAANLTSNAFTAPTGYTFGGWATSVANATAGTVARANGAAHDNLTSTNGGTVNLYAIWQRTVPFYHGANQASHIDLTQRWDGSTSSGTTLTTPAESSCTGISGWDLIGWRDDTTIGASEHAFGASVTPNSSITAYYAAYSRTIQFYHGYNKAKHTDLTQYRSSYSNTLGAVTTPTANTCTDISGWTELGWRADTTAAAATVAFNTATIPSVTTYYAVYSRTGTVSYSGGAGATGETSPTTSGLQYMSSASTTMQAASLSVDLAANGFSKVGYTFNVWDLGAAGSTYTWAPAYNEATARSATAQWDANTYTITYAGMVASNFADGQAATHGSSHPESATYDTQLTVSNPSKTGYTFTGWKITGMDSVTHTYGTSITTATFISSTTATTFKNLRSTSGTVTFTAQWTRNTYTVTCKDVFTNKNKSLTAGAYVELGSGTKTYDYYASVSGADWGTNADRGGIYASYYYNSSSTTTTVPANDNLVVYRYFTAWTNINILNPAGTEKTDGSVMKMSLAYGAPANSTHTAVSDQQNVGLWKGETITISSITPQQTYYLLDSVTTSSSTNLPMTSSGGTYTFTVNLAGAAASVRSKYSQYAIRFNAQGGSGTMSDLAMTYNTAKNLTANGFGAPTDLGSGWSFAGWATSEANANAGAVAYEDGDSVNNLAATDGAVVNLYAVWQRTITFKSGTKAATTTTATQYRNATPANSTVTVPTGTTTIINWTMSGWREDTSAQGATHNATGNIKPTATTLYAVYTRAATFKSGVNGATSTDVTQYRNTGTTSAENWKATIPATPTAINTWDAKGWRTDTTAADKTYNTTGDITDQFGPSFYAVYSRTLTITYDGNGNTSGSAPSNTTYTQRYSAGNNITSASFTLAANTFTKTGYTFTGWNLGGAGATYTAWQPTVTDTTVSKTAKAQWGANTYTVVYNANGGTGTNMSDSTFTYDTPANLRANTYTAPTSNGGGWQFAGWADSTAHAAAGSVYRANQEAHGNMTSTAGATVTIYAIWKRTVTFKSGVNGSTTATVTEYYDGPNNRGNGLTTPSSGGAIAADSSTDRLAWTLAGWRDDTVADTQDVAPNTAYKPQATTCYGIYTGQVNFVSGPAKAKKDGVGSIYSSAHKWKAITSPSAATSQDVSGWTERGWRDDITEDDREIQYSASFTPTAFAYYGVYSRTITFNSGVNSATSDTVTQYYNSAQASTTYSDVMAPAPATIDASGDRAAWTAQGWRDDTTADAKEVNLGATFSPSTVTTYYAVYTGNVNFKSGLSKTTTTGVASTYNSANAWKAITAATKANSADIDGWTELGWRTDTTAANKEISYGQANFTPRQFAYYGVYSRDVHFYSGVNKATDTKLTQYYNTEPNLSQVTTPTAATCTDIGTSGERPAWAELGWRDDTTAGAKKHDFNTTITPPLNTDKYYAVYSGVVKFLSGKSDSSTKTIAAYYNSDNVWSTIAAATAADCADLTNAVTGTETWTEKGWRPDTTADANTVAFGASMTPTAFVYHAVYQGSVYFRSGVDKATTTKKQGWYNSHNVWSTITSATAAECADILADGDRLAWAELGWRNDQTADAKELDFNTSFEPDAFDYYAVYSGNVNFVSGVNKATTETVNGYYNSANVWSQITSKTPAAINASGDRPVWTARGWRTDGTAADKTVASNTSFTPTAFVYYGVYSGDVKFISGVNKATTNTAGAYYNTQDVWSTITSPTPATIGADDDRPAWTAQGWRTDSTASTATVNSATAFIPTSFVYYGVYSGNIKFISGVNKEQSELVNGYYNTQNVWSTITSTTPKAIPANGNRKTWTALGWRTDGTATTQTVASATSFTPTAFVYYGVYSGEVNFVSGVSQASKVGVTGYYNTQNKWSTITSKTPVAIDASGDRKAYTALGWRTDGTATTATVNSNTSFTPTAFVYYGVYSGDVAFYSGVSKHKTTTVSNYYNTQNVWSAITAPSATDCEDIGADGDRPAWTELGWRTDTTAADKTVAFGATNLTPTTFAYYAVYQGNVRFRSGKADDTTTDVSAYYNTQNVWSNITAPNATTCSDLTAAKTGTEAWTEKGWRPDTTAADKTVAFGANLTPTVFVYHAVYSGNVYFRSGVNKATVTKKQGWYNSHNVWSTITSATANECTDIAADGDRLAWNELGWRNDQTADAKEIDFNTSFIPDAFDYYAVYSGNVNFISGVNKTTTETVNGYYNSANVWSQIASATPAAIDASGDRPAWTALGWRTDGTATTQTVNSNASFVPTAFAYYGVYSGNVLFKSGYDRHKTTQVAGHYNTQNVWSRITSASAADCEDINTWTEKGWRNDTDTGDAELAFSTPFDPDVFVYYAAYDRNISFRFLEDADAVTAVTQTRTQYLNSGTQSPSAVLTYPLVTQATYSWQPLGWRTDTQANATATVPQTGAQAGTHKSITPAYNTDLLTYYAIYQRNATLHYLAGQGTGTAPEPSVTAQWWNAAGTITTPSVTLRENTFVYVGHTFAGWDKGYVGKTYTWPTGTPAFDRLPYAFATAQWEYVDSTTSEGSASGQLKVSIPVAIHYVEDAEGNLSGPTDDVVKFVNNSPYATVHVSKMYVDSPDVDITSSANPSRGQIRLTVQPKSGNTLGTVDELGNYSTTTGGSNSGGSWTDPGYRYEWDIAGQGGELTLNHLKGKDGGHSASDFAGDRPVGAVHWLVRADTRSGADVSDSTLSLSLHPGVDYDGAPIGFTEPVSYGARVLVPERQPVQVVDETGAAKAIEKPSSVQTSFTRMRPDGKTYSYTFQGWNTKSDGTGITVSRANDLVTGGYVDDVKKLGGHKMTLYAIYQATPTT